MLLLSYNICITDIFMSKLSNYSRRDAAVLCSLELSVLKVSRSSAYLMMKRGDLPIAHVGTVIRVRPEDLERYIHDNATKSLMVDGEAQPCRVAI